MTGEVAAVVLQAPQVNVDAIVEQYSEWFLRTGIFLGTVLVGYLAGRVLVLPPVIAAVRRRNPDNRTLVGAIRRYLKVATVVVSVPIATTAAGFGGVVAGSAVVVAAATLALGVAGQDVIGNFVSGVFLVADPDFNVGDYVEWGDQAGTIEEIDLRVTRIHTAADEVVTVPNTDLATSAVRNPYSQDRYRITERLPVSYDADLDAASAALVAVAREDDRVLDEPAPVVHVEELGGGAVHLAVRFWVGKPRRVDIADVRTRFDAAAKERLIAEGITVAPASQQELSGAVEVRRDGEPAE